MTVQKPKVLFIYEHEDESLWKDGLWAALELLKNEFDIYKHNLKTSSGELPIHPDTADFILGWGAFGSPADKEIQSRAKVQREHYQRPYKTGLCIAGNAMHPGGLDNYDVLFYETEWYKPQIEVHPNLVHAFGVNTDIFHYVGEIIKGTDAYVAPQDNYLWDYLTVGAFATWKRQSKICFKPGSKMAVGQIQKNNMRESIEIVGQLILGGCGVSDMVPPEKLANFYRASKTVYIPADINGGGERAVLEARACGVNVEVEPDNAKLQELVNSPVWDHYYYAEQLKKGILSCLNSQKEKD